MAWSSSPLVHAIAQGVANNNTATTGAIDTTGADFIAISAGYYAGAAEPTLTDSKSNTWSPLTLRVGSATRGTRLYYAYAPTVGSGHTFTLTGSGDYPIIAVTAWSGSAASPFNAENGATSTSASSLATGSVSPNATDLFIAGLAADNGAVSISINSSFTISDSLTFSGNGIAGGMAYKISASAENPTWDVTVPGNIVVALASFKAAAGGGGVTVAQEVGIFDQQRSGQMVGVRWS